MLRAGTVPSLAEARQAITRETRRRPYRITYAEKEIGAFFEPSWNGHQISIEINKSHPFYEVLYGDLLETAKYTTCQGSTRPVPHGARPH